jgi:DNA gyrase subunit B
MYIPTGRPNNRDLCFEVPLGWRLFVALVGTGSARQKSVPDVMFNVDQSAQLAFLAGLYLGDGTKGAVSNRLSFATSSRSLASGIGYLLAQNGVIASISERGPASNDLVRNTRESFTLTVSGADQLAALRRVWQDAANSELLREQVAYRQGVAGGGARRIIEVSADTVAIPIVDVVTRGFEGDVYDFSVADDESFVCGFGGGLAAHNTDADVDGSHIRTLLLTFFYHWMRPLLEAGRVYSAIPPLYSIPVGKELRYAYSDAERDEILAEIRAGGGKRVDINRYKGLGEMEADELAVTTMDVATRRLRRVALRDAEAAAAMFDTLMGSSVEPRRRYIVEHSGLYDRSQLDI